MRRDEQTPIRFSVIVPVYNVENYLSACVKSVVEQPGAPDWECILVDDGSTDQSGRMCDFFAETCPGVVALHRENGGLAAARNTGLDAARGEWILFLDSDDLWPAGMLQNLRAALDAAPGYDWYVGRYLELDGAAPKSEPTAPPLPDFVPGPFTDADYAERVEKLYTSGNWSVWRFCIRRAFLESTGVRFWPKVVWAEDYPFDLLLLHHCIRLYFLDFPLTVYRVNRAGSLLNSNLPKHFVGILAARKGFRKLFARPDAGGFGAAEQQEVWRRVANVFWPQARAAAVKDKATRRACAPLIARCRDLYNKGEQASGRTDWVLFRWMLTLLGPRAGLWLAAHLKH